MIHIVYGDELYEMPVLADSMFKHRANQFHDRLQWDVSIDENGHETDQYDEKNPLYLIAEQGDGSHGGSMRFLPTTEATMLNESFIHLVEGEEIRSPLIWECTRFCLAPNADPLISWQLLMGTLEMGLEYGLTYIVGVFDKKMLRVYRRIGWSPEVIGEANHDGAVICAGLWPVTEEAYAILSGRSTIAAMSTIPVLDQAIRDLVAEKANAI